MNNFINQEINADNKPPVGCIEYIVKAYAKNYRPEDPYVQELIEEGFFDFTTDPLINGATRLGSKEVKLTCNDHDQKANTYIIEVGEAYTELSVLVQSIQEEMEDRGIRNYDIRIEGTEWTVLPKVSLDEL